MVAQAEPSPLAPVVIEKPIERHGTPKSRIESASRVQRRMSVSRRPPAPRTPEHSPETTRAPEPNGPATTLGSYNPANDLPGVKLPFGTIMTTAGPVIGYHAVSAYSATKTATPIEQIPQSIQVIPKSLLADQNTTTVTEALDNVSNVQGTNALAIDTTGLTGSAIIRGFQAQYWLDGLAVNYALGDLQTLSNVERVEVLKGPNAILYGGGTGSPVGGAYDIVSKLPTGLASVEAGVTAGSFGYAQPYFDINQPLSDDKTVLFRFTGAYTSAGSYIDDLNQQRYSLNPTLTFTNKSDTTLTIQGNVSRFNEQAYEGLPAVGTVAGGFRINPDMFIGNVPMSYSEVNSATVTFDHRFDSIWSFDMKARFTDQSYDQRAQTTVDAAPDAGATSWNLWNIDTGGSQREFTINPNLQARFHWGPTQNVWLTGADYSRVTDSSHMLTDSGVVPAVDLLNDPVFPTPYRTPNPASPTYYPYFQSNSTYLTEGVYTQLQSTLFDRIHLLGGLRLGRIDIDYLENYPGFAGGAYLPTTFVSDTTKLLPRVGAVVDLIAGLSVYASYSQGMQATPFTQAVATNIAPETSTEREAGVKINLWDQLTGTIAVFDIQRQNVPVTAGVGVVALSAQESRGYEADLLWQWNKNWKVLASYGHTDVVFSDSNMGVPEGNFVPGVPEDSGRVWAYYAFDGRLTGLNLGAGVYIASSQYVDNANIYKTPGYFTVDSAVSYHWLNYTASVDVKNLTGEKYFVPYPWLGRQVAPGAPRSFFAKLSAKF
jgi:iron complex outermembrane receptor protein